MRFTLHVVHPDDRPAMHLAMQPSLRTRMFDRRFTGSGLTIDDADALVPGLLEFAATPRTGGEIEAWLDERLDVSPKGVWWALRTFAPLLRAPTGGPWSFDSRTSFVAASTEPTSSDKDEADEALQTLIWRYLEGFGPASVADMALFALVARSRVRTALRGLTGSAGAAGRAGRRRALRRPRRTTAGRRNPGPAPAAPDVGQHPAGVRRPDPPHPAGVPRRHRQIERRRPADPAGRRVRRRGVAPGRRRHRGHGLPSPARRRMEGARRRGAGPYRRCSPIASPGLTAATTAGGPTYPEPRSDYSPRSGRAEIRPATCERGSR